MDRLAVFLRSLVVASGAAIVCAGVSQPSLAKGMKAGEMNAVAPIASGDPDVVAASKDAPQSGGDATSALQTSGTSNAYRTISPSIIALDGPPPAGTTETAKAERRHRFDPAPMVIRAGLIDNGSESDQGAPTVADRAPQSPPMTLGGRPAASDGKTPAWLRDPSQGTGR